jgi:3',5'-cyclic AMP phosphodiesterase CpdA
MHHPPVLIGLPWVDAIGLPAADRAALAELLSASPHVRAVVAGHVHRTVVATLAGCPVLTCPSTNVQARLELGATEPSLVNEPPAILVHALVDGELVTHVQPTTP